MTPSVPSQDLPQIPAAEEITRRAQSNLAFAFAALPRDRRQDAVTFYAFCRWVDDLADDDGRVWEERRALLGRWFEGCLRGFGTLPNARDLEVQLDEVVGRRGIERRHLATIVDGMVDDLSPSRFDAIEEVEAYNYKVACCVGLVSIRIFGCQARESEDYARSLGQALQWTNILRDVGEDYRLRRRIYLPRNELARFELAEDDIEALCEHRAPAEVVDRFRALMQHLALHAVRHYEAARRHRVASDVRALASAESMRRIYRALLDDMRRDDFQVFDKRYSLPKWKKFWFLFRPYGD